MATETNIGQIKLVIKSPNHQVSDVNVICDAIWTVMDLKVKLAGLYPDNPSTSRQRLIYGGKLLSDNHLLSNYFNFSGVDNNLEYVVHLVISKPLKNLSNDVSIESNKVEANKNDSKSSVDNSSVDSVINKFKLSPAKLASYQEEYKQYVEQYYFEKLNEKWQVASGTQLPTDICSSQTPSLVTNEPANQQAPVPPAPEAAVNRVNAMGVGIGNIFAADPNDLGDDVGAVGAPRDGIDFVYSLFRVLFMSAIIYYYSSMNKAVVSLLIFGAIILLQGNFLRDRLIRLYQVLGRRRNFPQPSANINASPADRATVSQPADGNPVANSSGSSNSASETSTQDQVNQPQMGVVVQPRLSVLQCIAIILKSLLQFVISFFASIIPERPPPIDIN